MKNMLCLCLLVTLVSVCVAQRQQIAPPVDTVFAKGGTCLYKIYPEYNICMKVQQERLDREIAQLPRYVTLVEQQISVNRIGCCAYWEFLSCVERAADEKCIKDRTDMEKYTRQLGSTVPLDICKRDFPRDSEVCNNSYSNSKRIWVSSLLSLVSLFISFLLK